jgi:hypothetical protein
VHAPDGLHPSPKDPQFVHIAPAVPHVPAAGASHTLFLQQPFGHDLPLHTHAPATQASPGPHWLPVVPQVHCPDAEQPSALIPHGLHAPPPAPHSVALGGVLQIAPAQQPLHEPGPQLAQVPPLQGQAVHWAPCDPHCKSVFPGSQTLPVLQHPLHELGSQTQVPLWQCWPTEQDGPPPQVHTPDELQPSPAPLHA